jgi:hypothetical protein
MNQRIITSYGKEGKGEEVARHKRITCKEYSHAETKNDEKVRDETRRDRGMMTGVRK